MSPTSVDQDPGREPRPVQGTKVTSERRVAKLFGLKGDSWMRHANPLSVWTRFSCLSLIALAIWSRDWIGWLSLVPLALAIAWLFANPLFFEKPASTRNWASRSVFGERIWLDRNTIEIPDQFRSRVPAVANAFSTIGMITLAYGLIVLSVLPVIAGVLIVHGGKAWYLDRMALLFDHMKEANSEFARWEY
jgi:hypothetical protein